ncbi:3-keto-disaccharide hydrolase [Shewanella baltica]|uniref:3-keto-disaccharide hydrolase n=1 Tax=Shewanella baltica TaxID=62322 RepID=UPI003D793B4A
MNYLLIGAALSFSSAALAATELSTLTEAERHALAAKTEVWTPVPPIVTAIEGLAPSDAIPLLDNNLSQWQSVKTGAGAKWVMDDGVLTVKPGTGDIRSKASFCDIQLHLEWRVGKDKMDREGQLRNNSGIFLQEMYEIQILDSYQNQTYPNGQAGSVYKQTMPLANATRASGEWQQYDIIYQAPKFDGEKRVSPGFVTVLHNGVLVQNHTEIAGTTEWIGAPQVKAHGCLPLKLQDHGDSVSFRNIWVRKL